MPKQTFYNLPEEKRKRIIDAAYNEFLNYKYSKASIKRIADNAEIPVGSFYQYFKEKKDLFLYLANEIQEKTNNYYRNNYDILDFFNIDIQEDKILEDREIKFIKALYNAPHDVLRDCFFEQLVNKHLGIYEGYFERLKEKNLLNEKIDTDIIAYVIATIGFNIFMCCKDKNMSLDEIRSLRDIFINEIILKGVSKNDNDSINNEL